ncbi:MAG TPA: mechanosensitive ion channel [Saprospiraceae bacterium]|nr:mechanosensitive ion channel [Saprospiraceae bacterium]HMQ82871.1 mechanosensitive ion channel [Saprospiraceae bacterium]
MNIKVIETVVVLIIYILIRIVVSKTIDKTVENRLLQKARGKVVKKGVDFILLMVSLAVLSFIWGVNQSELVIFISSFLAVLGIALFAQWSILSNITSGIIIFFSHPVKLDDTICILDKEYPVEGSVSDIGLFFVIIKTKDGEKVTVPSNVFVQKMIKYQINA